MDGIVVMKLVMELAVLSALIASDCLAFIDDKAVNASSLIHAEMPHAPRPDELESSSWDVLDEAVLDDRSGAVALAEDLR
jgi:hypothetical protein